MNYATPAGQNRYRAWLQCVTLRQLAELSARMVRSKGVLMAAIEAIERQHAELVAEIDARIASGATVDPELQ